MIVAERKEEVTWEQPVPFLLKFLVYYHFIDFLTVYVFSNSRTPSTTYNWKIIHSEKFSVSEIILPHFLVFLGYTLSHEDK